MTTTVEPYVSRAPKLGFVGGLDGLRGIGVVAVMVGHAFDGDLKSFAAWVDVFFVISGFLITTLLIQEYQDNRRIDARKFFTRRAYRLLPGLWVLFGTALGVTALVDLFGGVDGKKYFVSTLKEVTASFFYVYHLFYPVNQDVVGVNRSGHDLLGHLWSLSIEEQFYLVIVPTMIFILRRNRIRLAMGIMVAAGLAIAASRFAVHPGPRLLWVQRPDGLIWGTVGAFVNSFLTREFMDRHRRRILAAASVAGLFTIAALLSSSTIVHYVVRSVTGAPKLEAGFAGFWWPMNTMDLNLPSADAGRTDIMWWWRFGYTLAQISTVLVILCLARYKDWWLSRFLSVSPFRWLGRLSYTLYIWHGFVFLALEPVLAPLGLPAATLVRFVVSFAIAVPLYYKVELPFMTRKLRYTAERNPVDVTTGDTVGSQRDS